MMKFTVDHQNAYTCHSVAECQWNLLAEHIALSACVDAFAGEMKRKLLARLVEGKSGWDDPAWPPEAVMDQLRAHIDKGDMVDVANFAMFKWNQEAR